MTTESEFPADVLTAIHSNRKIDAIKLLREYRGIGLKEAKHEVDAYIRKNRHLIANHSAGAGGGLMRLALIGLAIVVVYMLYRRYG